MNDLQASVPGQEQTSRAAADCLLQLDNLHRTRNELLSALRDADDADEANAELVQRLIDAHQMRLSSIERLLAADPELICDPSVRMELESAQFGTHEVCDLLRQQLRLLGTQLRRSSELRRSLHGYAAQASGNAPAAAPGLLG